VELDMREYDYGSFTKEATGGIGEGEDYKIISCPFGKYEVKVKLSRSNEFIEIVEVGINKDFLTQRQKISLHGFHDVERFYVEE
jgi:hypothetical protein